MAANGIMQDAINGSICASITVARCNDGASEIHSSIASCAHQPPVYGIFDCGGMNASRAQRNNEASPVVENAVLLAATLHFPCASEIIFSGADILGGSGTQTVPNIE